MDLEIWKAFVHILPTLFRLRNHLLLSTFNFTKTFYISVHLFTGSPVGRKDQSLIWAGELVRCSKLFKLPGSQEICISSESNMWRAKVWRCWRFPVCTEGDAGRVCAQWAETFGHLAKAPTCLAICTSLQRSNWILAVLCFLSVSQVFASSASIPGDLVPIPPYM